MRFFFLAQYAAALFLVASGTSIAQVDVISIDSSFTLVIDAPPVTIQQQQIYFLEEGYTPAELGFPGLTRDEFIALMEEPEHSITGVPEPTTWTMMLLGFVGLGFAGWRSSRRIPVRV